MGSPRRHARSSILCNAIEDFYPRFGYVFAWPEPDYIVQTKDLSAEPPHVELHAFPPKHHDDLAAIYNRENATITGTAVRPTFLRTKMPRDPGQGYFWTGTQGHAAGYIIYGVARDGRTLWCEASAGDPEERLRILAMLARQAKCEHVRFGRLPYKSGLCKRLRRLNCRAEAVYSKTGGWMIRLVNLQSLIEKLAPELSRRLQMSHLAEWRGNLRISAEDDHVMLAVDRSHIRILPSDESAHTMEGGADIAQLIIGTESPDEIVEAADITLTGDAAQLVEVLFPKQYPQMSNADL